MTTTQPRAILTVTVTQTPLPSTSAPAISPNLQGLASGVGVSAALGAVLGVIAIASTLVIVFLWRRNRRLVRAAHHAQEAPTLGRAGSDQPLHSHAYIGQEESPEKLKEQLSQVRSELAAVAVLAPSTVRDQSDYVRDLNLLNDSIRQLSMRINRNQRQLTAAVIRTALYGALQSTVFDKFDAGLDASTEEKMSFIMSGFDKPSTAALWKAMTVNVLPLASPESIASLVMRSSPILSGSNAPAREIIDIVLQALKLSRAMAEDGKGFSVLYRQGDKGFVLVAGTIPVVA